MNNAFIRFSAALILTMGWILAAQQVLYAPHLPGDSFTAGVILLTAVLLQYVVLGREQAERRLPLTLFLKGLQVGVALLLFNAVAPLLAGKPMLTALKIHIAGHELSSTVLFELAVLLIVLGGGVTALVTFKEPD